METLSRIVVHALVLSLSALSAAARDTVNVMFWNVENFFDWRNGGNNDTDLEFSQDGARHWTRSRFNAKCNSVAKTLMWEADESGSLPDIVGLAEIENAVVLKYLTGNTLLRKFSYSFIHFDSPDPRGIDVALLYRRDRVQPLDAGIVRIGSFATRDILYVKFMTSGGGVFSCLVNHHPSKYGGRSSAPKRLSVMKSMLDLADSLNRFGPVLSMGDFNDTPDGEAPMMASSRMMNLACPLSGKGEGTIKFEGKWELIDMFFASPDFSGTPMRIVRPPFLLCRDNAHSGYKPFRTWSGPRWNGGVSDHLPVAVMAFVP